MHQEYYDTGGLAKRAGAWGAFALLCLWIGGFFGVVVGLASLLFAMAYITRLTGDRVALRFGQDVVELHGIGRSISVRWDDVEDVTLLNMRSRLFGFLPTFRSIQLTLIAEKDRQPLDVGVPVALLALDRDGLARLLKVMIMSRAGGYDLLDPASGELRANPPPSEPAARPAAAGFGRRPPRTHLID